MTKIYTTIEQSQRLMELGLDVNTADMYYHRHRTVPCDCYDQYPSIKKSEHYFEFSPYDVPAWSLSALLELMPEWGLKKPGPLTNGKYSCWDNELNNIKYADTPIDAAFKMVCWALENKEL